MPAKRSLCWPACMSGVSNCLPMNRIRSIRDLKGKKVGI
jgi:hypothetical protein